MVKFIQFDRTGGPEVLEVREAEPVAPGPDEVWLSQHAIGVNFLDILHRRGAVAVPLPNRLGLEAAGEVMAVGEGVTNVAAGDRVAYALGPLGAYATGRVYPANRLVKIPQSVSYEDAAAILFKGLTAQYLLKSTYPVSRGAAVLVYGAGGGLGRILCSWAKALGAEVIGVVSKPQSVDAARAAGADHVLIWGTDDLPSRIDRITGGRMVDVVYDGIGRDTFDASLASLRVRGTMVSIGAQSGPPAVSINALNAKSLFLTRPGLADHIRDVAEYADRAEDVFSAFSRGIIRSPVWKTLPLTDAAEAHATLQEGRSLGPILLLPSR